MSNQDTDANTSPDKNAIILNDVKAAYDLVLKAVIVQESRFCARAVRSIGNLRSKMTRDIVKRAVSELASDELKQLTSSAFDAMDTQDDSKLGTESCAETDMLISLLCLVSLVDESQHQKAVEFAESCFQIVSSFKSRSCDLLKARWFYYLARSNELNGTLSALRPTLHSFLRAATLNVDENSQSVLINWILRSYLADNLVQQAQLLISKTTFPSSAANNESARFLFYAGIVKAIQLDYSDAHQHLTEAARKAPKNAVGFQQLAAKFGVIVTLLLGDIPEREIFRQKYLSKPLLPYFELTQAVRKADLGLFNRTISEHKNGFLKDKTYLLILRVRQNVIKTGVRMISLSYSRIHLKDVATRLQLDSAEDAEYIVAKCIRDGVITATINHKERYVQCQDVVDVYSTSQPQDAYHDRVKFCLSLHNDSVKAMRYPPNAYRKYLETPEQRRQREELEAEIAEELQKEDEGEDEI